MIFFAVKDGKMSKLGFTKSDNFTRCMNSAVYSLAMREHSRLEIYNKLSKKDFVEGVDLDKLLDKLEENNYLNDERFAESFIRYRSTRGQGAIKITSELRLRGVNRLLVRNALLNSGIDWFALAKEQKEKKFGLGNPRNFKEKAKQMRFLYARGFDSEIIRTII